MSDSFLRIESPRNPRVKQAVKLRRRSHRDELGLTLIEGYRELRRAIDNGHHPRELFICPELFQGENNDALVDDCRRAGAAVLRCGTPVFRKLSYRDRPDGLLGTADRLHAELTDLSVPPNPLFLVAESIEKPGNLGTMLRSADAAGADAVLLCDPQTDLNNPNVVRASIGTVFSIPVAEVASADALPWLRERGIRVVATSPHATHRHTEIDLAAPCAIAVGTKQVGLSQTWIDAADAAVRIPMFGQSDSINAAQAATILLYEAVRQRLEAGLVADRPPPHTSRSAASKRSHSSVASTG